MVPGGYKGAAVALGFAMLLPNRHTGKSVFLFSAVALGVAVLTQPPDRQNCFFYFLQWCWVSRCSTQATIRWFR